MSKSKDLSRRAIMSGAAALPAVAVLPAVSAAATIEPDPIFDAIEMHRRIWADDFAVACQLDQAEGNLEDCRAHSLVGWRKYSHIGGSEIDHAREEFLRDAVADPEAIEREYRAKKAEHRAGERAGRDWDRKHGLASLRTRQQKLIRAGHAARKALGETMPIS